MKRIHQYSTQHRAHSEISDVLIGAADFQWRSTGALPNLFLKEHSPGVRCIITDRSHVQLGLLE